MREVMFDLETLDTRVNAVVLSIGAVVFETKINFNEHGHPMTSIIHDRFYRVIDLKTQFRVGRTVSQDTLLWWMQQDANARDEAFSPVRVSSVEAIIGFNDFISQQEFDGEEVTRFWASSATFDFPIWESFCDAMGMPIPWMYNQKYDVRSVVTTANYSAKDHVAPEIVGLPPMPVYDCEWQVSLLNAARKKLRCRL